VELVPGLDEAAVAAALACGFTPAVKDGKAVAMSIRMPIVFRLGQAKS
jgi:TonB family protein